MMKKISKLLFFICIILCLVVMAPEARAAEIDFEGKSWDEVIEEFLAEYNVSEGQVTIGYYNTVTEEEHFYDADRYMITGSMYKVPLTMVFAEKAAAGEIDLEKDTAEGFRYTVLMEGAIVQSNNDYAATLWRKLGSYHEYRRVIAPYMGEDPDNVDEKYYENNFFTARQMLTCLKRLYGDEEKYGTVIELMKKAEQREYFCRHEDRYQVAHKYGYLADDARGILYLNDCGIIYTDDPYLLVCFTAGVEKPYGLIGNLCTLMSDYTQYQRKARLDAEAAAEAERRRAEAEAAIQEAREQGLIPATPEVQAPEEASVEVPAETGKNRLVLLIVLFALCGGLTIYAEIKSERFDLKRLLLGLFCILACLYFWLSATSTGGA